MCSQLLWGWGCDFRFRRHLGFPVMWLQVLAAILDFRSCNLGSEVTKSHGWTKKVNKNSRWRLEVTVTWFGSRWTESLSPSFTGAQTVNKETSLYNNISLTRDYVGCPMRPSPSRWLPKSWRQIGPSPSTRKWKGNRRLRTCQNFRKWWQIWGW